jgi:sporulation protein YabP
MASGTKPGAAPALPRRLTLEERERLTVTGVGEVVHFDETAVAMRQGEDLLVVRGEGLALRKLEPGEGKVEVRGRLISLAYEQAQGKGGFLRRLIG